MQLTRNGVSIQVDDDAIMDMVLRNVLENRHPAPSKDLIEGPQPVAKVINNNRPGWTNIIETKPNVTLDIGTKLYLAPQTGAPRIGAEWPGQGGIYAGIMRGRDGVPDYHLIVGPQFDGELKWQAAMDWTTGINVNLHKDFSLPFRSEQALLFANVSELFEKSGYWSHEQHAEDAGYAWLQLFYYGSQGYYHKDNEWRARAVRRLVI